MKQRETSNFFISDLSVFPIDSRQPHPGATRVIPSLVAAAVFSKATISASLDRLSGYVAFGERAHGLRDAGGLMRTGQAILDLPLGAKRSSIGNYYSALSLNRLGPKAYPEANRLLQEVADNGPDPFRAKAMVALATNLNLVGERSAALPLFAEAGKLAVKSGPAGLHSACILEIQAAFFDELDGNYDAATARLRRLSPLMRCISAHYPPLLHFYYNNLAAALARAGEIEEALALCHVFKRSPFLAAYPEWQDTCSTLEARRQMPGRPVVTVPSFNTVLPSNVFVMPITNWDAPREEEPWEGTSRRERVRVLSFSKGKRKRHVSVHGRGRIIQRPALLKSSNVLSGMSFQQKQALALRLLLSDEVTERELDQFLLMTQVAPGDKH